MSEPSADAAAAAAPIAPVLFKARGRGKAKANMRKRSPSPPPANDSDSDSDGYSSEDGGGGGGVRGIKRQRKTGAGVVSASSERAAAAGGGASQPLHFADRKTLLADSDAATKTSHLFDEDKKNAKSEGAGASSSASSRPAPAATRSVGPIKAPANIRTITITDFSPDVCKDYKVTGFCGFGDSCKFLHARENYKQGWQLDNEWEAVTKGKKNLGGTVVASASRKAGGGGEDDDEDDEEAILRDIPFACVICRKSYKRPVVTRCGHYFCERCALDRYRRDPTCAACGGATTGVFNSAKRLTKLLERKRERVAKRRQAAIEAGEEVSSEEEEGVEDSD